jgi:hypothetical protein
MPRPDARRNRGKAFVTRCTARLRCQTSAADCRCQGQNAPVRDVRGRRGWRTREPLDGHRPRRGFRDLAAPGRRGTAGRPTRSMRVDGDPADAGRWPSTACSSVAPAPDGRTSRARSAARGPVAVRRGWSLPARRSPAAVARPATIHAPRRPDSPAGPPAPAASESTPPHGQWSTRPEPHSARGSRSPPRSPARGIPRYVPDGSSLMIRRISPRLACPTLPLGVGRACASQPRLPVSGPRRQMASTATPGRY